MTLDLLEGAMRTVWVWVVYLVVTTLLVGAVLLNFLDSGWGLRAIAVSTSILTP